MCWWGKWSEGDNWGDLGIDGLYMWRVWFRREGCIGFRLGNRREGVQCGNLGLDGFGMWLVWVRRVWCSVLMGKPEEIRPLGRPRGRWARHVPRMGEERGCISPWCGNRR